MSEESQEAVVGESEVDTYHFAFRRTWDKAKVALRTGQTLESAIEDLKTHTERDFQKWIKTGHVWTSLKGGTQCCVERDVWLSEPHLVPMEIE